MLSPSWEGLVFRHKTESMYSFLTSSLRARHSSRCRGLVHALLSLCGSVAAAHRLTADRMKSGMRILLRVGIVVELIWV